MLARWRCLKLITAVLIKKCRTAIVTTTVTPFTPSLASTKIINCRPFRTVKSKENDREVVQAVTQKGNLVLLFGVLALVTETISDFVANLGNKAFSETVIGLLNLIKTIRTNLCGDLINHVDDFSDVPYVGKISHYLALALTLTEDPCRFNYLIEVIKQHVRHCSIIHENTPKEIGSFIMGNGLYFKASSHRFNSKKMGANDMLQRGIFSNNGIVLIKLLMAIFTAPIKRRLELLMLQDGNSVFHLYSQVWLHVVTDATNLKISPIFLFSMGHVFNLMSSNYAPFKLHQNCIPTGYILKELHIV